MGGLERRKYPRFDVNLALKNFCLDCRSEITATTSDISDKGIGCRSDRMLPVGERLDIWLYPPDGDPVQTEGTVVWSVADVDGHRMGIDLGTAEIKAIPLVLRAIRPKLRHYS